MGNNLATPELQELPPQPSPQELSIRLPPSGESFTCEICIEPFESPTPQQPLRTKNKNCGSQFQFCNDCMIKYIKTKLDDNVPKIPCPALNCPDFLDPHDYRVLVGPSLFVRWCDVLCESELMGKDSCYCPNPTCSALIMNEYGGTVKKSKCPNCKNLFCFQCKLPWHAGFRCEESGELRDQNDREFGFLAERRRWMRCPQCHYFVELRRGCTLIHCRCGSRFCYNCGRKSHMCRCRAGSDGPDGAEFVLWVAFSFCILLIFCFPFYFWLLKN